MLWVICAIIAILVGVAMFAKLQPELPSELDFLKNKPAGAQVLDGSGEGTSASNMTAIPLTGTATGWTFQTDGSISEASKDFDQPIAGPGGQVYDKPAFAVTCYQGHLYARVNSRIRAAGKAPLEFDVKGLPGWAAAPNQNWYSTDAGKTLSALKARGSVSVRIAYEEVGTQVFTFNTNGLSAILSKMPGCRL
jgi:hypothetical protein